MKKTPIMELIDWIVEIENSIFTMSASNIERDMLYQFRTKLERHLQKEKAFAFDCFEAGMDNAIIEHDPSYFEQFYSQYAAKHNN